MPPPPPAPRSGAWAFALPVIVIAAALLYFRAHPAPIPPRDSPEPVAPSTPIARETAPSAPLSPSPPPRPSLERGPAIPSTPAPAPAPDHADAGINHGLDLHSAEATVDTQVALLRAGREAEFVATFLPEVRERLTPRAIARCRARVVTSGTPLVPDWEMAEESVQDSQRVRRVSMYGHETTGFHDVDGQWLADRAWCVPTSVPDDADDDAGT